MLFFSELFNGFSHLALAWYSTFINRVHALHQFFGCGGGGGAQHAGKK